MTAEVPQVAEEFCVLHEQIKLITVNHPKAASVSRDMNRFALDGDAIDRSIDPTAKGIVMIPWNVHDVGASFGFLHEVS